MKKQLGCFFFHGDGVSNDCKWVPNEASHEPWCNVVVHFEAKMTRSLRARYRVLPRDGSVRTTKL